MKVYIFAFLVLIVLSASWCNKNKCEENTAPEINFELLVGGSVLIEDPVGKDITTEFHGHDFVVHINKIYCDGTIRGPFEEFYLIDEDGRLDRIGIGTWGFRMDNNDDYMKLKFFLDGKAVGEYDLPYNIMQKYDQGTGYFEFLIKCKWDESQGSSGTMHFLSLTLKN